MNTLFIVYLLVTGLLSSTAFFLFPVIAEEGLQAQISLAVSFATNILQVGAIWFFLTSLHAFKKSLRTAYYWLAFGILLYGFIELPSTASAFLDVDGIVRSWLILIPLAFGSLAFYLGMRKFARLLDIHYIWRSFLFATGFAVVVAIAAAFIPHTPSPDVDETTFHLIIALLGWSAAFSTAAAILAIRIRKALGGSYKMAMGWLVAALVAQSFAGYHELFVKGTDVIILYAFDYIAWGIFVWPFVLASILFLRSGIAFRAISKARDELPENASYVDVVSYAAQLVSSPSAIDVTLDKMRQITARQEKGVTLSNEDKSSLVGVYVEIERYLITKEPLLKITKEELRSRLPEEFQQALTPQSEQATSQPQPAS